MIEKDIFGYRKKQNYITLAYKHVSCALVCYGHPEVWIPQLFGEIAINSSDPILDAVEFEVKRSRVARHLGLGRPWEESDGVLLVGAKDDRSRASLRGRVDR